MLFSLSQILFKSKIHQIKNEGTHNSILLLRILLKAYFQDAELHGNCRITPHFLTQSLSVISEVSSSKQQLLKWGCHRFCAVSLLWICPYQAPPEVLLVEHLLLIFLFSCPDSSIWLSADHQEWETARFYP